MPDSAAETAVPEHDVGLQSESIESDITDISQEAALPLDAYAAAADKTALPELDFPDEDVFTEPASNDKPNNDFRMKPSAAPHRSAAQGSDAATSCPTVSAAISRKSRVRFYRTVCLSSLFSLRCL